MKIPRPLIRAWKKMATDLIGRVIPLETQPGSMLKVSLLKDNLCWVITTVLDLFFQRFSCSLIDKQSIYFCYRQLITYLVLANAVGDIPFCWWKKAHGEVEYCVIVLKYWLSIYSISILKVVKHFTIKKVIPGWLIPFCFCLFVFFKKATTDNDFFEFLVVTLHVVTLAAFQKRLVFCDFGQGTGAPNDGFLLNGLKTLFRLSRVLLDL